MPVTDRQVLVNIPASGPDPHVRIVVESDGASLAGVVRQEDGVYLVSSESGTMAAIVVCAICPED